MAAMASSLDATVSQRLVASGIVAQVFTGGTLNLRLADYAFRVVRKRNKANILQLWLEAHRRDGLGEISSCVLREPTPGDTRRWIRRPGPMTNLVLSSDQWALANEVAINQ